MAATMTDYQVLARRYRPKKFEEVIGQDPIVKTLKNALRFKRLAHAYLFCGSRGTGKTTLARIFAKALNCPNLSIDFEPCSNCPSCMSIASSSSIDVLEIDGASHRGIDDIRIITDSVSYSPTKGHYKIYLIDEVHMLTKEAFNALLKTLEEPPPQVKFFFATTEPHKLPETILSRCQRFNLRRIPLVNIVKKLQYISSDLKIDIEEEALFKVAEYAEGSLRDAESLFDQIIAFSDGKVASSTVYEVLGIMPRKWFFDFDKAFFDGNMEALFQIASELFLQGKELNHFLQDLAHHFRKILLLKIAPKLLTDIDSSYIEALKQSEKIYSKEQVLAILDQILDSQSNFFKNSPSEQIALEGLLMRLFKVRNQIGIDLLVKRLSELEEAFGGGSPAVQPQEMKNFVTAKLPQKAYVSEGALDLARADARISPVVNNQRPNTAGRSTEDASAPSPVQALNTRESMPQKPPLQKMVPPAEKAPPLPPKPISIEEKQAPVREIFQKKEYKAPPLPKESGAPLESSAPQVDITTKGRLDTLIQFAGTTLNGTIQRRK